MPQIPLRSGMLAPKLVAPRRHPLPIAALAFASIVLPLAAHGDDAPTLSGTWSATAMTERWNIGDWGNACGPRPSAGGAPGGTVTIAQQGSELVISGAGRTYRTTDCWEQVPGGTRSHSAGSRGWRTVCKAQPNDPRQATITTTLGATDSAISFDETGQYQFVIQGQNCTASVRRTRSFTLVRREGETAPAATATATPTSTPTATATATAKEDRCASPGEPARVEVRPARKLMKPGERFTFRAVVADANGCVLDVHPSWGVATVGAKLTVTPAGTVSVGDDATDGTVELLASVAGRSVRVSVEVATAARYEALLAGPGMNDAGEQDEAAVVTIATGSIGGAAAVAPDAARARKTTFLAIVAAVATALAAVGIVLLRKNKRSAHVEEDDADDYAIPPPRAPEPTAAAPAASAPAAGSVCPSCRRSYAAGIVFCHEDGTRLVPAGDPLAPAVAVNEPRPAAPRPAPAARGKICPTCGDRFGADATFCGKDGTSLVLVN